jgi:DNA (cytosine-5)-methyltransferase 1
VIRYGSVCSGIEAATVAWHPIGWEPAWFSEIDPFPCAVLAHHYPNVPNLGDMTTLHERTELASGSIDLLVGGTPCQSFSVAGLRKGLADPRGNLALVFLSIADRARPRWVVWENVPGVLSSSGGRDFGAFLGGLGQLGYGFAYRVLDAQYFGVAQRRKRVFVVGCLGDWRRAAAVLFERASLSGNPAPRRQTGERASPTLAARTRGGGGLGTDHDVTHSLTTRTAAEEDGTGRGVPIVPTLAFDARQSDVITYGDKAGPLDTNGHSQAVTVFDPNQITNKANRSRPQPELSHTPPGTANAPVAFSRPGHRVRRLIPRECERLQGFPDDYTLIPYRGKPASDGPRYKALGNSMCVNVMAWIGRRIDATDPHASGTAKEGQARNSSADSTG